MLSDLVAGMSWDEIAYRGELVVMAVMILGSVFAVGLLSNTAASPSKF